MKNRLLVIAGILAIPAVVAGSYATPAAAQWMTAALVKNIDERGRAPYMEFQARACPGGGEPCQISFPEVPQGMRLVVEHVNAGVNFADSGIRVMGLLAPPQALFALPGRAAPGPRPVIVNEAALVYYESGQSPVFHLITNSGADAPFITVLLSGYFVIL